MRESNHNPNDSILLNIEFEYKNFFFNRSSLFYIIKKNPLWVDSFSGYGVFSIESKQPKKRISSNAHTFPSCSAVMPPLFVTSMI